MALAEHFRTYRHRPYWNAHPATREKRATEENYPWLDDGPFDGPEKQKPRKSLNLRGFVFATGGEGGIRTHGTVAGTPDFESGTFDHSATSPGNWVAVSRNRDYSRLLRPDSRGRCNFCQAAGFSTS